MLNKENIAILLFSCPDRKSLVARISAFISDNGGNIINLNEYVDTLEGIFFLRVSWSMDGFHLPENRFREVFQKLAEETQANYQVYFSHHKLRMALFVSKYDHCLRDILWRQGMGEFNLEFPLIISNSDELKTIGDRYGIPWHTFEINAENKSAQESKELEVLKDYKIEGIVLARYMQILSPNLINAFTNNIINIHHSFLPAFVGRNPYRQAYERGVKIIGATSHYVTAQLDEGPIISQDIAAISHKDSIEDLTRKGRDLERLVLAKAVRLHAEHRILVHGEKTIVFD